MSIASTQLPTALQTLIDSRLDTIDRMLLGRVPRQDRVAIVREVESQVFELLSDRDDPSREDVLAVLARLDPPEAYLSDEDEVESASPSPRPRTVAAVRSGSSVVVKALKWPKAAGIVGIIALGLLIFSPQLYLVMAVFGGELLVCMLLFAAPAMMLGGAVFSIAVGTMHRRSGAWAVVGIVTGITTLTGFFSLLLSYVLFAGMQ